MLVLGGKVSTVHNTFQYQAALDYKACITVLALGSNDIDQQTHPKMLAAETQKIAQEAEEGTGGKVCITDIESRLKTRFMTPVDYNIKVVSTDF